MPFAQSLPVSTSEGMAATAGFTAYPADASFIVRLSSNFQIIPLFFSHATITPFQSIYS